nr:MAG TPA: hypothetical protein [Caudoviricetes sp.]DAU79519.1 MAG TPA: hypothetical protein [Caudoviricetes sp.]
MPHPNIPALSGFFISGSRESITTCFVENPASEA